MTSRGKKLENAKLNDYQDYGEVLVRAGISTQVAENYLTTFRQFLTYTGGITMEDIVCRVSKINDDLRRALEKGEASQAPVITRAKSDAMTLRTRRVVIFQALLGIRWHSLKRIREDDVVKTDKGLKVQIKEFKYLPDNKSRWCFIGCNCIDHLGNKLTKYCVVCDLGLPNFKKDIAFAQNELERLNLSTHSAKVTAVITMRKLQERYQFETNFARVYNLLGWSLNAKTPKKLNIKMFNYYARFWKQCPDLENLLPISRPLAATMGMWGEVGVRAYGGHDVLKLTAK